MAPANREALFDVAHDYLPIRVTRFIFTGWCHALEPGNRRTRNECKKQATRDGASFYTDDYSNINTYGCFSKGGHYHWGKGGTRAQREEHHLSGAKERGECRGSVLQALLVSLFCNARASYEPCLPIAGRTVYCEVDPTMSPTLSPSLSPTLSP